jgi:HlyD family secretion protein
MDRNLNPSTVRRRRARQWAIAAMGVLLLFIGWRALPDLLRPSLKRSGIRTAQVVRGPLEASIQASGTVVPAFEKVVSSPVDTQILRILKQPGELVRKGETILELDTSNSRLEYDRLIDQVSRKSVEQDQLRAELAQEISELERQRETRQLDFELLTYRQQQQQRLHDEGLTSEEALRQAKVEVRKAEVELRYIESAVEQSERITDARLAALKLDLAILIKERDQAQHRLDSATTRSDVDGVLTWIVEDPGVTVQRGDTLARIADLESFRVEATVSDAYASRLAVGQRVMVKVDEVFEPGRLSSIFPSVESGAVRFLVELDDPSQQALRPNLRVDVSVVTDSLNDVLQVRKGPFAQSGPDQKVFVLRGDRAVRTEARFGVSGSEHFEIVNGVDEGGEIIISNMKDYMHLQEVKIK